MKGILSKKIILPMFVFFALPLFSFANTLTATYSPTYPSGGDRVSVSVSSFDIDVNQSEISWYKDDKFEAKGMGMKHFSFTISENGNTIRALAKSSKGNIQTSIRVNTSSMDVLWEVVGGYEPPFYKGKVYPVKGSQIRVVAIPQIKNDKGFVLDAKSFTYGWKKDESNIPGQAGFGKNSFTYSPNILDRENNIEVTAGNTSRSLLKNLTITPSSSEIHFYEYDLVYGPMYNKAVKDNQTFNKRKINLLAEPYFIFTNDIEDYSLETEWKIGSSVNKPERRNLLLMNIADNINKVDLSFRTDNKNELLQSMTRSLKLNISTNE